MLLVLCKWFLCTRKQQLWSDEEMRPSLGRPTIKRERECVQMCVTASKAKEARSPKNEAKEAGVQFSPPNRVEPNL